MKPRGIVAAVFVVVLLIALIVMLTSPQTAISVFGEWGYRHLVSTDTKVKMINDVFADPSRPFVVEPGGGVSVAHFTAEILYCKSVDPLEFVLTGSMEHESEVSVDWIGNSSFCYAVEGYPIQITVSILDVTDGQARISILAAKTGP